jgi:Family of unknown function (DUF5681)
MSRSKPPTPPWQPGQSGNPNGRPVGSRNKLTENFITALHDDFPQFGRAVISKVREKQPAVYLKVIASILPRQFNFKHESAFDGMSNEQLDEMLGSVRRILAARSPEGTGNGEQAAGSGNGPDRLH